jgi:hypothetical protein
MLAQAQEALQKGNLQEILPTLALNGWSKQMPSRKDAARRLCEALEAVHKDSKARVRVLDAEDAHTLVRRMYDLWEDRKAFCLKGSMCPTVGSSYRYHPAADVLEVTLAQAGDLYLAKFEAYRGTARKAKYRSGPSTVIRSLKPHHTLGEVVASY